MMRAVILLFMCIGFASVADKLEKVNETLIKIEQGMHK